MNSFKMSGTQCLIYIPTGTSMIDCSKLIISWMLIILSCRENGGYFDRYSGVSNSLAAILIGLGFGLDMVRTLGSHCLDLDWFSGDE